MGFEFKVISNLTANEINDIHLLLDNNELLEKKYEFENKLFWDLKNYESKSDMPDTTITIEQNGIYICQYLSSYLWTNVDNLKNYFEKEVKEFKVDKYED